MEDKGDAVAIKSAGDILSKMFQQAVDRLKDSIAPIFDDSMEMFGTNIAVVLVVIRDVYGVSLPPRLNPVHIDSHPHLTQNPEGA